VAKVNSSAEEAKKINDENIELILKLE